MNVPHLAQSTQYLWHLPMAPFATERELTAFPWWPMVHFSFAIANPENFDFDFCGTHCLRQSSLVSFPALRRHQWDSDSTSNQTYYALNWN